MSFRNQKWAKTRVPEGLRSSSLQLPFGDAESSFGINLGTTTVINFAHAHDLAIQYWTVNAEEDMAYLASVGADALITDYPDRAAQVLHTR